MSLILIAEDEVALSDVIRAHLEKQGLSVVQVFNGSDVVATVDRRQPDLVILDWLLPGTDGLTVCRELRRKHLMPILMLTARGEVEDRVAGLEVGADDYLGKPFSLVELEARVKSLLRRIAIDRATTAPGNNAPVTFGSLVIDATSHSVTLGGTELDLTRREMELLDLLLRHPGRTFSRAYLLDRLWGSDFDGLDRAVDTQMVRLRRKLGEFGDCIEAVWGVGYRFRPDLYRV